MSIILRRKFTEKSFWFSDFGSCPAAAEQTEEKGRKSLFEKPS